MKKIFILGWSVLVFGCGQRPSTHSDTAESESPAVENEEKLACYAMLNEKDTVRLSLEKTGNSVSGTLIYQLYEKDKNIGTIEGVMRGDTLLANYDFASEGVQSVRQVAFLMQDNLVMEGYGPMEERDGALQFIAVDSLQFGKGVQLLRVQCDD